MFVKNDPEQNFRNSYVRQILTLFIILSLFIGAILGPTLIGPMIADAAQGAAGMIFTKSFASLVPAWNIPMPGKGMWSTKQ